MFGAHRAPPSLALHVYRLRKLQRLQARSTKGDFGQRHAGSAHRVGRRAEDAPEDLSLRKKTKSNSTDGYARMMQGKARFRMVLVAKEGVAPGAPLN